MLLGAGYLLARRHRRAQPGHGRDAPGHPHRPGRRPVLPLAARPRPHRLGLMRLEARGLGFGYPGHPVGRDVDLSVGAGRGALPARPQRLRQDHPVPHPAGPAARPGRRGAARTAGRSPTGPSRDRPPASPTCRRLNRSQFAYTVLEMVLMGRTAHLGPFARPSRADVTAAERALDSAGHPQAGSGRLHADQRRPAAADADRPRPGAGGAAAGDGRADRQPRFRQSGGGAAPGAAAARAWPRHRAVDPRSGPGVCLRHRSWPCSTRAACSRSARPTAVLTPRASPPSTACRSRSIGCPAAASSAHRISTWPGLSRSGTASAHRRFAPTRRHRGQGPRRKDRAHGSRRSLARRSRPRGPDRIGASHDEGAGASAPVRAATLRFGDAEPGRDRAAGRRTTAKASGAAATRHWLRARTSTATTAARTMVPATVAPTSVEPRLRVAASARPARRAAAVRVTAGSGDFGQEAPAAALPATRAAASAMAATIAPVWRRRLWRRRSRPEGYGRPATATASAASSSGRPTRSPLGSATVMPSAPRAGLSGPRPEGLQALGPAYPGGRQRPPGRRPLPRRVRDRGGGQRCRGHAVGLGRQPPGAAPGRGPRRAGVRRELRPEQHPRPQRWRSAPRSAPPRWPARAGLR